MRVEQAEFQSDGVYLKDKSRSPRRGGNSRAWHQYDIPIDGEKYSFLATWTGKFVYKGETVSFHLEWDESGTYSNVDVASIVAWPKAEDKIVRGDQGSKK